MEITHAGKDQRTTAALASTSTQQQHPRNADCCLWRLLILVALMLLILLTAATVATISGGIVTIRGMGSVVSQCKVVSAVEVLVQGPISEGAVEYEVQAGVAAFSGAGAFTGWPSTVNGPVLSVTGVTPKWRLDDLLPNTTYEFRMRVRSEWSEQPWVDLGRPVRCATPPLRPRQALLLPPTDEPSNDSVVVLLQLPTNATAAKLEVEGSESILRVSVKVARRPGNRTLAHRVSGLQAGMAYTVRATAMFAGGAFGDMSPAVVYRTADTRAVTEWVPLYRISEFCGDAACAPDYLKNHAASDRVAISWIQLGLLRVMAGASWSNLTGARKTLFPVSTFDSLVTTRYCVRRTAAMPWADYLSCNAVPSSNHNVCECMNPSNRCMSRDTSRGFDDPDGPRNCPAPFPEEERPLIYPSSMPRCECEGKEEAYSHFTLGRMPVYEVPTHQLTPHYSCQLPPLDETPHVGWYFSAPAAGECVVGEAPRLGVCGWAREPRQDVTTGSAQLGHMQLNMQELGQESGAFRVSQLLQHSQALDSLLDTHGSRCCGC